MGIHIRSSIALAKYISSLERVLFIDNNQMPYYESIKSGEPDINYKGISKYFKKIYDTFLETHVEFLTKLPERDELQKAKDPIESIVLDIIEPQSYITEGNKKKSRIIIACPNIEKIFYFKSYFTKEILFKKLQISNFIWHPQFSRIKITQTNIAISDQTCNLSYIKFLYLLPSDAEKINNSIREFNGDFYVDNLIPAPTEEFYTRKMVNYYISSLRIENIKRDEENLHQIILECLDYTNKKFNFYVPFKDFKNATGIYPEEITLPIFVRALIFQEFCESFRQILRIEKITEEEFKQDSLIAFVNFRKKVPKTDFNELLSVPTDKIFEEKDYYFYKVNNFDEDDMDIIINYKTRDLIPIISKRRVRDYIKFHPYSDFMNMDNPQINLIPVIFDGYYEPIRIHRYVIAEYAPIERLKFYCYNKKAIIFCLHCKAYKAELELSKCPHSCPNCDAGLLTKLINYNDDTLFSNKTYKSDMDHRIRDEKKIADLFLAYRKYTFFVLAAGFSLKRSGLILGRIGYLTDSDLFFEKLLKMKQEVIINKKDFYNQLYKPIN